MTAVITDAAGVCNLALAKIGYKLRIGSLYDGTLAAKKLLDVYGITRDAVLRAGDWNFAQKTATLVPSAAAAPYPWTNSYTYPADCLRVRSIYDPTAIVDLNNPLPSLWQVADDPVVGRLILTRAPFSTAVYTVQETDPSEWDPMFLDALATALGRNLRSLAESKEDANLVKIGVEEIGAEIQAANEVIG